MADPRLELEHLDSALSQARTLKEQARMDLANELIQSLLPRLDLDRNLAREYVLRYGWSGRPSVSQQSFLEQARKLLGPQFSEELANLQTLAEIRRQEGRPQEALRLELACLERRSLRPSWLQARKAYLYELAGHTDAALSGYRAALVAIAGEHHRRALVARLALDEALLIQDTSHALLGEILEIESLAVSVARFEEGTLSEQAWDARIRRLEQLHLRNGANFEEWMKQAVESPTLCPLARASLQGRLGHRTGAFRSIKTAVEEGFGRLNTTDPGHPFALHQLNRSSWDTPVGEFVIFSRDLGPVDTRDLLRSLRANQFAARLTGRDPGFRGFRDGSVVVELVYEPETVRRNLGALTLGESPDGRARVYGGSITAYMEKNRNHWPADLTEAQVKARVATYIAKHEILVHHSGNFLLRGIAKNYRGNIRTDAYAKDGFLESNNPKDVLGNLPTLLSPSHPLRAL